MEETRRSYDDLAERYAAEIGGELSGKPLDRALLALLVELAGGGPVADLGCGPGHVTAFLAGLGASAVGVDLSPRMCAVGLGRTGLPFAAGDLTALPLKAGGLAALVCLYAVIHIEDRAPAYAEMVRVLRPGGHALVSFHVSDADVSAGGAAEQRAMWGVPVALTFRYLDPALEAASAASVGLELVARADRAPYAGLEHPSRRSSLLLRRPD